MNLRLSLAAIAMAAVAASSVDAAPRVHHGVHRQLRETGTANIVVVMKTKPTAALRRLQSTNFGSRGEKIEAMVTQLDALSAQSQKGIDEILAKEAAQPLYEAEHRSWATNSRFFNGATIELVEKLATLPDVALIREQVVADLHIPEETEANSLELNTIQWGVQKIEATKVWADGNIGQNVVVGSIDTGVRYSHEILRKSMRENYNWYDPDNQSDLPFDTHSHGTHTVGTIVGAKGFGVAPGAKWMACRGCPARCPEFNLVKCGEFMTCPTDTKGQNRDCSKAPHVINNSWGGDGGDTWYADIVAAWRAAGIIPVFSQGNAGPNCSTAGSPGDYPNVIGVGATSANETLAFFSSRGPALSGLMKPDISAPGLFVLSSTNTSDTAYTTKSGTSMAAPHVAGAIALLLSSQPELKYDDIRSLLIKTVDQDNFNATASNGYGGLDTCGGVKETVFPNNHYGYGRLNVFSAYQGFRPSPAPTAAPTQAPTAAPTMAPTMAPTPAPTPAPTATGFCGKFHDKGSCQFWFWCNWDKNANSCGRRF